MPGTGEDGQGSAVKPVDLDETDREILLLLAENARHSVRELARRIQMSPGAVAVHQSGGRSCPRRWSITTLR